MSIFLALLIGFGLRLLIISVKSVPFKRIPLLPILVAIGLALFERHLGGIAFIIGALTIDILDHSSDFSAGEKDA